MFIQTMSSLFKSLCKFWMFFHNTFMNFPSMFLKTCRQSSFIFSRNIYDLF